MSDSTFKTGQFFWADLTTDSADTLKEFYKNVIGWQEQAVPMKDVTGSYADYAMKIDQDTAVSGICHHRGTNLGIPPQWILYIQVENVEVSLRKCLESGGKLVHENRKQDGSYNYVIVQDPVGALFGMGKMV